MIFLKKRLTTAFFVPQDFSTFAGIMNPLHLFLIRAIVPGSISSRVVSPRFPRLAHVPCEVWSI